RRSVAPGLRDRAPRCPEPARTRDLRGRLPAFVPVVPPCGSYRHRPDAPVPLPEMFAGLGFIRRCGELKAEDCRRPNSLPWALWTVIAQRFVVAQRHPETPPSGGRHFHRGPTPTSGG